MIRNVCIAVFCIFIASIWCRAALAEVSQPQSCLPEAASLQSFETLSVDANLEKTYRLKSLRFNQMRDTPVLVTVKYDPKGSKKIHLKFRFEDPTALSLPFNIYGVFVSIGGKHSHWMDLTDSCTQPGIGFFPGQEVELEPGSLELTSNQPMHLTIWGRH